MLSLLLHERRQFGESPTTVAEDGPPRGCILKLAMVRPFEPLPSSNARKNKNRYLPCCLFFILGENRHLCGLLIKQPLPFFA